MTRHLVVKKRARPIDTRHAKPVHYLGLLTRPLLMARSDLISCAAPSKARLRAIHRDRETRPDRVSEFREALESGDFQMLSCLTPGSRSDSQLLRSSLTGGPYERDLLAFHRAWQERDSRFRYLFSCAPIAGQGHNSS